jgi:hypothetical protein
VAWAVAWAIRWIEAGSALRYLGRVSAYRFPLLLSSAATLLGFALGFAGCGGGSGDDSSCRAGTHFCPCLDGLCEAGLVCLSGYCLSPSGEETGDGDPGDGDPGDGDGDSGDGDGDSGDGDGDSGDGDGDSGDGDGDSCQPFALSYTAPKVMLLVDASGSMVNNTWDHDNNPNTGAVSRWYSLVTAVQTVAAGYDDICELGVQRFPAESACDPEPCYNSTACIVENTPEAGVAPNNGATVLAAIPSANAGSSQIEGSTPTHTGFDSTLGHLLAQGSEAARYIVLITDGAANCNEALPFPDIIEVYDETLAPAVAAAYQDEGVPTFVVGIDIVNALVGQGVDGSPEANPYQRLNEVALAGGVPKDGGGGAEKFYNSGDQGELELALEQIFDSLLDCTIDLAETPGGLPDPQQIPDVSVESDGSEVPLVGSCAGQDGWAWVAEGETLSLCGSYCEAFASGASVSVSYGCG